MTKVQTILNQVDEHDTLPENPWNKAVQGALLAKQKESTGTPELNEVWKYVSESKSDFKKADSFSLIESPSLRINNNGCSGSFSEKIEKLSTVLEQNDSRAKALTDAFHKMPYQTPLDLLALTQSEEGFVLDSTRFKESKDLLKVQLEGVDSDNRLSPVVVYVPEGESFSMAFETKDAEASTWLQTFILVVLEKNSQLQFFINHDNQSAAMSSIYAVCNDSSHFDLTSVSISRSFLLHNIAAELLGTESQFSVRGLGLLEGDNHLFSHTRVGHRVENANSDQLFKTILRDRSKSEFNGLIYVEPEAQQTDSNQTNHNLVLSDSARALARPQLEIFADDVRATHGSSTGQLDETVMFYLKNRGLSDEEAKSLMVHGFANEIIDAIPEDFKSLSLSEKLDPYLGGRSEHRRG